VGGGYAGELHSLYFCLCLKYFILKKRIMGSMVEIEIWETVRFKITDRRERTGKATFMRTVAGHVGSLCPFVSFSFGSDSMIWLHHRLENPVYLATLEEK